MVITQEEVLKIAEISRIAISDNEIQEIASHLSDVINYAERVTKAAQLGEPESFYYNVNVFRKDEAAAPHPASLLGQAPQEESDFFVVPAVLEQE